MENIKILDLIVPNYTEKFLSGQYSLDEMPLLEAIGNSFSPKLQKLDLQNVHIVACQHLLRPQLVMFQLFVKLGINPSQILILPKVYSANRVVFSYLQKLGCTVFEDALTFNPSEKFDDFHNHQCKKVVEYVSAQVPKEAKLIILDDGGMLLNAFADQPELINLFQGSVYGVEQTASGKNILLKRNLPFIVTSVASSIEKITIETGYIIRHAMVRIEQYFIEHGLGINSRVLVLGKGPIGNALISKLVEQGYTCDGYDITDGSFKGKLKDYDVIIGATGNNSLSVTQLGELKRSAHLISVSSSDREFPSVHIRNSSIQGTQVHDTFVYKENNIHLINGGFPISFKGNEIECYPLEMDVTKMKLAEAVLLHIVSGTKVATSVNELYGHKRLKFYVRLIFYWWILFGATLIGKIFWYGIFTKPPLWVSIWFYLLVLIGCIPAVLHVLYHRRLEKFL